MFRPRRLLPVLAVATLALAACESSEDRAERNFRTAMELVEAGDIDRAMVAFRNVFRYDGFHLQAREAYAALLVDIGDTPQAYSQYLRLIEQYPDNAGARRTLAEIAIARADWDEAERHGTAALALTPDDPAVQAIGAALDYRAALVERDAAAQFAAAARAEELLRQLPDSSVVRQVVIHNRVERGDLGGALSEIENALRSEPDDFELQRLKLSLLARMDAGEAVGEQLRAMVARFPDREDVRATLIDWYIGRGDTAAAEGFLREIAGAPTDDPMAHAAVVQFIGSLRGVDAARAELDRLTAAAAGHPNADAYRTMLAEIDFSQGAAAEAIAALEAVLAEAEASDQTRRIRVTLARMLEATGATEAALAQVETVLAEDPTNVGALQLRAARAIAQDRPEAAILDLRTALGQEPRDPALLTLMAQAHERNGARELAGEMLARAVEVSNRGPAELARYARFLQRAGRSVAAEGVLADALQVNPGHVPLLEAMADLHLAARDWPRVREVVETLRLIGSPAAEAVRAQIEAALLVGEGRIDEGIALLEDMVDRTEGDVTMTAAAVMQSHLGAGRPEAARDYIDGLLAERAGDPMLRMLSAGLHAAMNELPEAEALLRGVIADTPALEAAPQMLYGLLLNAGRAEDAAAVLDAALAAQPDSDTFLGLKAEERLRANDYEGAIALYDRLYARNPENLALANNLASLLTSFRSDEDSLARGHAIARRLRGIPVPAFQDTYGWIEYRRGNHAEALTHLEPAAAALPGDPLVQFHLGMAYAALDRTEEAIERLTAAIELAGDSPLPQFAEARRRLAELTGN